MVSQEANVVAICRDHHTAGQAVAKLRDASFGVTNDVTKLSLIGNHRLLGALVTGLGSAAVAGDLAVLADGLMHLGTSKEDAIKYGKAITAGKFLVNANGAPEEVARARRIFADAFVP
jgi:hypothetical protein